MKVSKDRDENTEEFSFIQEKIVPKPKNTKKKMLRLTCYVVLLGVIFGLVSSFTFQISQRVMKGWNKEEKKEHISLGGETESEVNNLISQAPGMEDRNQELTNQQIDKITGYDVSQAYDIRAYQKMYSVLRELANESRYSMVTVFAIKDITSWFDKENYVQGYGIIIRIQDDSIYILCNYNKVKEANKLEVEFFNEETVRAEFMDYNKETSLALLKVKCSVLSRRTKVKIKEAEFGNPYEIGRGTPVMGLGAPDGTMNSMQIGYITARRIDKYIVDGRIGLYHTSIMENPLGEGYIVDMGGKVIGIITHLFKEKSDQNIMSFLDITHLKPIIEAMLNEKKIPYLGVKVSAILSRNMKNLNVNYGVYITDVIANSPAFKKGIRPGDVITQIDETSISSVAGLMRKLAEKESGDKIRFTIMRQTKIEYPKVHFSEHVISVTLE